MKRVEDLVHIVAVCWLDAIDLREELGACTDTANEALRELHDLGLPTATGEALAEAFGLWLADEKAQQRQREDVEMRRNLEQLLREWMERKDDDAPGT